MELATSEKVAVGPDGTYYWTSTTGIQRVSPGATMLELWMPTPCGRGVGGYAFRLIYTGTSLIEGSGSYWYCEVLGDGTSGYPIIVGRATDGPDYESRISRTGLPVTRLPDGTTVFVDGYPPTQLKILRPLP